MELASYCNSLATASAAAGQWVERNGEAVRNEKEGLLKELRRAGRLFRSCARAADRKMCAGVFGPSQAGKSYLISALARNSKNELGAVFGSEIHDFISEINPEGGKESTGLVTRFTLTPEKEAPAGFPVRLAMLSEMDIVKIIANTYYADCEHKEDPQSDIGKTLGELAQRPAAQNVPVTLDDFEELREYLAGDFRAKARVQELERSYWDEALKLGPKLDLEGRIRLYALIWDEVEEFTGLLRRLLSAVEELGHPETCFCSLDALLPREKSIIDVATLAGLDSPEADLDVAAPQGKKLKLPRAIVTALTAELTIVMSEKPADYFEYTDLLDFPGYRSRYKLDDVRKELKKDGMLKELFLRGKVAYLFQRYCARRELNSMLLCIGPSNQEVQDLPGVINAWIGSTHGETPEEREGKQVSIFLILTKFDMEFEEKKGAPSLESRWDNRLHASLLDFFGKQHDWPTKWTPTKGFDNIFLLRNPNFQFRAIMEFSGDTEIGIQKDRQEYVDRLKNAFMGSSLVAEHFRDKERAWNEAMRLNDGGISYIRESLSPVCNPDIKKRQLLQNVNAMRQNILRRLENFYKADDREGLRKQKLKLFVALSHYLGNMEKNSRRLGQLLRRFTVTDADIYDLFPAAMRRHRELAAEAAEKKADAAPSLDDIDIDNFDLNALDPFGGGASAVPVSRPLDEADVYAEVIESKWVEKLHEIAGDPAMQSFFMLPDKAFSDLATELAVGAERLGLRQKLASEFRETAAYANTSKTAIARRQAALAARRLNSYVDWLGHNPHGETDAQRMVHITPTQSAAVFKPVPDLHGLPDLDSVQGSYTDKWFIDWRNALGGLIMDNVNFDGSQTFDAAENDALGAILKKLAPAAEGNK